MKGTDRCSSEKKLGYIESSGGDKPDVWFLPSEVWEIRGAGEKPPFFLRLSIVYVCFFD